MSKALAVRLELLGPDHPDTLLTRVNLAAYEDELASSKEAIEQDTAAIAGFERTLGADHPRLTIVVANLGLIQLRVGNIAEADRLFARAEALSKPYGPKNRRAAIVALLQCRLRVEQGRMDDALARANDAVAGFAAIGGEKSDANGEALVCRGSALLGQGKAHDGIEALEQGIALREVINRERLAIAGDFTLLAEAELANGKPKDALAHAERAVELSAKGTRYPGELARTRFALARALVATGGDRTRAGELAKQASDELAPLPYRAALAAQVADWTKRTRL
jgi:serine/threonine-protein kinase